MMYDVVIVGGGPSGLSAALALGRARKRVLLCDAGPRRNAAALHIHNFVTRDGTPPSDFRHIARQQLERYPNVQASNHGVTSISGTRGAFRVTLEEQTIDAQTIDAQPIEARRILLCTGMIDEMLSLEGFRELWGRSIFQCPYCHGWEMQDRRWGYLARPGDASHLLPFALQALSWTRDFVVFTNGGLDLPHEASLRLEGAGIRIETAPIARLVAEQGQLEVVELDDGRRVPCELLFAHPAQRQVPLVRTLDLTLDADGYVQVDPMRRETSAPGIYASGDLATRMQGAVIAAAAGTHAAAMINLDLMLEPL